MKKINFTNATVTAPASVEIDGVSHDVTPAVIEGGTLPTPDNINQLQNNVEEAILNPVVESIKSENQFNKDDCVDYYYLDYNNGQPVADINMSYMKSYIPVKPNEKYTMSYSSPTIFVVYEYDSNKTFLRNKRQNTDATSFTVTISEDTYFVRLACGYGPKPGIVFAQGDTAVSYMPFKRYGYNSQESMGSIVVDDIRSKNLFNLQGNYTRNINSPTISGNSIILPSSDGNGGYTKFSQKIEVNSSLTFSCTISDGNGYARPLLMPLDSSGNVITDLTIEGYSYNQFYGGYWKECADGKYSLTLNFPSNVKFLQLGFIHVSAKFTDIQIEKGNTATSYTPYKNFDNTDNGWVDIELANTYSFLDLVAYNGLQCRKIGNQVFLRGMLINSVANPVGYYATCGFVPEECRPKKPAYLICNQEGGPCNCTVETDGGIRVYNTKANSWIALDSMRFFVD